MTWRHLLAMAPLPVVALAAGCAANDAPATVQVYAAASLVEPFGQLEADFEHSHPEVDVVVTYAGSAALAAQILEGAPADVFASANGAQMSAVGAHHAEPPEVFASNSLAIAVERGNPLDITTLADLERGDVLAVMCAPQVPCGDAALRLAASQNVVLSPASEEASVTDVLGKIASGQADAGLVYVTDLRRSAAVDGVSIDGAEVARNTYEIAPLTSSSTPALAVDFVAFVVGADGQAVLAEHGFGAP